MPTFARLYALATSIVLACVAVPVAALTGLAPTPNAPDALPAVASGPIQLAAVIDIRPPTPEPGSYSPIEVDRIMAHIRKREYDEALALATTMTKAAPKEPIGFKLQGAAYFGKGSLDSARASFERALALRPDDNQALVYLAQLDVQQRKPAAARTRYEAILAREPKYPAALIGLAQIEADAKNEKSAVAWYEKARDADPDALLPRLYLGNYYLQIRDVGKATSEATEANRLHPDNPDVLDLLGRVQLAGGLDSQALRTFRQLVSAAPDSVPARMRLATTQIKIGDAEGAASNLRAVVKLKPDFVDAAYMLAVLDAKAGRGDDALKVAKNLQASKAGSPYGYAIEGDVLLAQRKYADAQKAYEHAFAISKTTLFAIRIHQAQEASGRAAEANARLRQWMDGHADETDGWEYLAGAYIRSGQRKTAIEQYERILKREPKNALAMNNLAGLYLVEKDPKALATAEQAYALAPQSPATADTLGWVQIEQGDAARGLELVRKALDADPKNPEVRYHAAVGLARSGNKAEAKRTLERLLADSQSFGQRQAAMDLLKEL